jgi:hypothetical protein
MLGFLLDITPSVQGNRLVLTTDQEFCVTFMSLPENKAALEAAAQAATGQKYTVVLNAVTNALPKDDPLLELLKENEE